MRGLAGKKFVEAFRVKADHHLLPDYQRGRRAALVGLHQLPDCVGIAADVALLELDTSRREVGLDGSAGWSAGLGEYDNGVFHSPLGFLDYQNRALNTQMYSMTVVMVAVFCSMAETEQYFSLERRTASSMPFFETWPLTL